MNITIIGSGNVGSHLARALSPFHNVTLLKARETDLSSHIPSLTELVILTVKDDVVDQFVDRLKGKYKCIVHTSGSVARGEADGVIYPLQTFSKHVEMDYAEIPFFIEGKDPEIVALLKEVAASVSNRVYEADSELRKTLHIAAVFACNFTNHLYTLSEKLLAKDGIPFDVMLPLIDRTVEKIHQVSPADAQTGPAARGDQEVISDHLAILAQSDDRLFKIYDILSRSIINH